MTFDAFRETLAAAAKRAQQEAQLRIYELQEYERRHGFHRPRLNPEKAYAEVTGRNKAAGAESDIGNTISAYGPYTPVSISSQTITRRNAEDIHD